MKLKRKYLPLLAIPVMLVFISATVSHFTVSSEVNYERVQQLVDKKLTKTVIKHAKKYNKPAKMFSRCPSGIMTQVEELASSEEGYSTGEVMLYVGCGGDAICQYRARLSDETVEVYDEAKKDYIPASTWLEDYKKNPEKYIKERNTTEPKIEKKEAVPPPVPDKQS